MQDFESDDDEIADDYNFDEDLNDDNEFRKVS